MSCKWNGGEQSRPQHVAITTLVFLSAHMIYSCCTQPHWWKQCGQRRAHRKSCAESGDAPMDGVLGLAPKRETPHNEHFFGACDVRVLHSMKCFQNNPVSLMRLCVPSLLSLAFCPVSLFVFDPMTSFFWSSDDFDGPPTINEAISAFLVPAGLVYAIAFGFALQDTMENLRHVTSVVNEHVSAIKQIAFLVCESSYSKTQKLKVLRGLKNSLIYWMRTKLLKEKVDRPLGYGEWIHLTLFFLKKNRFRCLRVIC